MVNKIHLNLITEAISPPSCVTSYISLIRCVTFYCKTSYLSNQLKQRCIIQNNDLQCIINGMFDYSQTSTCIGECDAQQLFDYTHERSVSRCISLHIGITYISCFAALRDVTLTPLLSHLVKHDIHISVRLRM